MKLATTMFGAMLLAGCDFGAHEAALRAELAANAVRREQLEHEVERLRAELTNERETRQRECVMAARPSDPAAQAQLAALLHPPEEPTPTPIGSIDLAGIQCAGERCEVPRKTFEALVADPTYLVRQMRIVPNMKDGAARGFKVFAIRAGSPMAVLGLKNGDVITTLGEFALDSPDQALAAYAAVKGRNEWLIAGDRKGTPFVLTVLIKD